MPNSFVVDTASIVEGNADTPTVLNLVLSEASQVEVSQKRKKMSGIGKPSKKKQKTDSTHIMETILSEGEQQQEFHLYGSGILLQMVGLNDSQYEMPCLSTSKSCELLQRLRRPEEHWNVLMAQQLQHGQSPTETPRFIHFLSKLQTR
jgi:hypothetical protein